MSRDFKMLVETQNIVKNIKELKIQGASNILISSMNAIHYEIQNYKGDNLSLYMDNIFKSFWYSRPTEPAVKNFICKVKLKIDEGCSISYLLEYIEKEIKNQKDSIIKIAKHYLDSINEKKIIFTHCHSSIVEYAIIRANEEKLLDFAINTETRPLFQGRITAKVLTSKGIKLTHMVDSAVYSYISNKHKKNMDFLTGADVVDLKGNLVNKIGTAQISFIMNNFNIPHKILTTSNKFDFVNPVWKDIEIRSSNEIWDYKDNNLEIKNYAFDVTNRKYISQYITEFDNCDFNKLKEKINFDERLINIWNYFDRM